RYAADRESLDVELRSDHAQFEVILLSKPPQGANERREVRHRCRASCPSDHGHEIPSSWFELIEISVDSARNHGDLFRMIQSESCQELVAHSDVTRKTANRRGLCQRLEHTTPAVRLARVSQIDRIVKIEHEWPSKGGEAFNPCRSEQCRLT